jgi:multidrug transporter EmrE-like cation transporter
MGSLAFNQGLILSLTEIIGDYGAKIQNPILAYGGYLLLARELLVFLRRNSLTMVNSNWDGISNLITMIMGFLMGERFTQKQYAGLAMISLGLFLIN